MWRRCGTTQNYFLAFTDELEKQILKTWRYHYFTPVYQNSWWYDLKFLRYRVWQTEIGKMFCSFTPLKTPKIKILKNWKKWLEISSFYTCVTKITIIWCTVPVIWSETQNFLSFFAILPYLQSAKSKLKKKNIGYYKIIDIIGLL